MGRHVDAPLLVIGTFVDYVGQPLVAVVGVVVVDPIILVYLRLELIEASSHLLDEHAFQRLLRQGVALVQDKVVPSCLPFEQVIVPPQ